MLDFWLRLWYNNYTEREVIKIMYDIIDFAMENGDEIIDYEITYYGHRKVLCGEPVGEVEFTMKNGDKHIFQMC
jgi:hypothetical protein